MLLTDMNQILWNDRSSAKNHIYNDNERRIFVRFSWSSIIVQKMVSYLRPQLNKRQQRRPCCYAIAIRHCWTCPPLKPARKLACSIDEVLDAA